MADQELWESYCDKYDFDKDASEEYVRLVKATLGYQSYCFNVAGREFALLFKSSLPKWLKWTVREKA